MVDAPAALFKSGVGRVAILAHPFGQAPQRAFNRFVLLPAVLLFAAVVGLAIAVLVQMADDIGRLENAHDVAAMHAALDSFLNSLGNQVADEGTWNEAYLNAVVDSDAAWMDTTWGAAARLGQAYDVAIVTDVQGTIIFGENATGAMTGDIGTLMPAAKSMLHELDQGIAATGDATTVSHFAIDKAGALGLAAISIHQTGDTGLPTRRQIRRILWIGKHVTPALLQDIAVRYQTSVPVLVDAPGDGQLALRLRDTDGNSVGTVAWYPDRPSEAALGHALTIAALGLLVIGAALLVGLALLRRAIGRRAAIAEAAFEEIDHKAVVEEAAAEARAAAPVAAEAADDAAPSALDGISPGEFEIEYQPIFDLRAETLIGAEALLRWRRRDGSLVPQESLAPADTVTLLDKVGLLAIRRATDDIAPLLGLPLSIAITPEQVRNSVFAEKVSGTLRATNFPLRRLQLSVAVSALPAADIARPALANLKQTGVGITLSDYLIAPDTVGFVEAGLADRIRLPVSAIAGIDAAPLRLALVEATLNVVKLAGFAVTAPGVSRKEEAAKLVRLGCREFQGELFAPPMSIAALTQLVLKPATRQAG